jgi:hypothetical protein
MEICESIVLMYFQKGGVRATSVVQATTLSSWAFLPDYSDFRLNEEGQLR